jgi:hypothetical protein
MSQSLIPSQALAAAFPTCNQIKIQEIDEKSKKKSYDREKYCTFEED